MSSSPLLSRLALLCDSRGFILKVLEDELGLIEPHLIGGPFTQILDAGSVDKGLDFFAAIQQDTLFHAWELIVTEQGRPLLMYAVGALRQDGILIVAMTDSSQLLRYYEELAQINSEQTNSMRMLLKQQAMQTRQQTTSDAALYEEISRLNNELVTTQREMVKKNAQLEHLNEQKNEFLGMAAHDLRNPLGAIAMFSKYMLEEGELTSQQRDLVNIIYENSQFTFLLLNDLLDISQIEAGKLELVLRPASLVAILQRNITLNRLIAHRKQIDITFTLAAELPEMLFDAPKLQQVFDNLLSNAIKFSHPGTTIQVSMALLEEEVLVAVKDQGQGIPPHEVTSLFRPFSRSSVQPTAGEKSTGLGLAIVRRIVEGHGGKVWVESVVNEGSTFFVRLPVRLPAAESMRQSGNG